ncbi:MAG: hypothetical protein HGB36_07630 [Chlorobiaceae bacterium]|nr:hypothetical protein [Chlorobiaceae bacterium]
MRNGYGISKTGMRGWSAAAINATTSYVSRCTKTMPQTTSKVNGYSISAGP